jgi:hypothetical protein
MPPDPHAQLEKLRAAHAAAQATADQLRARLTKLEAKLAGEPTPETGLEMLWAAAPPMARPRASKDKCRVAWNRIPAAHRPRVPELLSARQAWSRCEEWQKEGGQFVPSLDRWIKERRWEDLPPSAADPHARYRCPQPTPPPQPPADAATPEDLTSILAGFEAKMKEKFK